MHMKRADTQLFKRPGQDRGAKYPTPGATRMCESPGVARGGWSGLELTDT